MGSSTGRRALKRLVLTAAVISAVIFWNAGSDRDVTTRSSVRRSW
jgi:hypothetical protein